MDEQAADLFRRYREQLRFVPGTVMVHASYLLNLAADDVRLRERSVRVLRGELELCAALGVDYLVLHPGAHKGQGIDKGLELVVDGAVQALQSAPEMAPALLFENTAGQGTYLGGDFAQLGRLVDAVSQQVEGSGGRTRVGVCFDTCHAHVSGYDLAGSGLVEGVLDRLFEHVSPHRLLAFHLNDTKEASGSRKDRHCRLGEGKLGWAPFVELATDARWSNTPAVLETPPKGRDRAFAEQIAALAAKSSET